MHNLNEYLHALVDSGGVELRLEPNKEPYVVSSNGNTSISASPLQGTQISMMVFPLIPASVRQVLPDKSEVGFTHRHNLRNFEFEVKKSSAGFVVSVRPGAEEPEDPTEPPNEVDSSPDVLPVSTPPSVSLDSALSPKLKAAYQSETISIAGSEAAGAESRKRPAMLLENYDFGMDEPDAAEQIGAETYSAEAPAAATPAIRPQDGKLSESSRSAGERMDALFRKMSETGASDLHLSVSVPPMVRKDGKMSVLEFDAAPLSSEAMRELLFSIMPAKNREEFERRSDTDFAYEIAGLARFRCNVFADRKGPGGVFRIIPNKILTAEQLGLSKAIMDLCSLSKGLVVVTGPTGSGKSTTLCAMVDSINKIREDHIITIEDPIEFVHENQKCLINQREVHNHTASFKDALRAALREDPDILLVGEMRDLETISIAIETAETGHLVFGTLHTTTAASTVDRIIDQFPADRQQQVRVMLSESLRGVIAQTLLPKKGGGRIAALEVLIITPAISNLIREGKTFQIPSAMQTGKSHGMVMLNDSLFDLVKKGIVEPRDAYIKAVDKTNFETMLTRGGFKL